MMGAVAATETWFPATIARENPIIPDMLPTTTYRGSDLGEIEWSYDFRTRLLSGHEEALLTFRGVSPYLHTEIAPVERLRIVLIVVVALLTAAAVSFCGIVAFGVNRMTGGYVLPVLIMTAPHAAAP